jgi:hypothetical protein
MFMGRVKRINIGFNTTLKTPKKTATHKAAQNPAISTPGII